ncbi:hypothetical protein V8G54_004608 [Vigna mungo]|uniref:non-specific serine/threonine protein kinase n=1 Tax=Vigna mungo TaxID=3915 RepID=A0AAQ3SBA3_VIGMU
MANLVLHHNENVPVSFLFLASMFLVLVASISSQEENKHEECSKPFSCGLTSIYYPFWGGSRPSYCASNHQFKLNCEDNQNSTLQLGSQTFQVLHFDPVQYSVKMVRTGIVYDNCSSSTVTNNSVDSNLFRYLNVRNITIYYGCPYSLISNITRSFQCKDDGNKSAFYGDPASGKVQDCDGARIEVQVAQELDPDGGIQGLNKALSEGFEIHLISEAQVQQCLKCVSTNGTCGANNESQFSCFCPNGSEGLDCSNSDKWNWRRKLVIGVAAAVISGIVFSLGFYIYYGRLKKKNHLREVTSSVIYNSKGISHSSSLEDYEKGNKYIGVHFFTYSELEEATNFFNPDRELGDGGFGKVYFGKLQDGRLVAVKRMYENSLKRVEQFVNEVEILTGLHHQNLVSLYGCTPRHSRELLLVYEYIPNGTVADHLHGQRAKPGTLPWHIRMNIAIETASALVYLHASDIIHRDVKTSNILLDNHFSVKVADFGLSRPFPIHATHVSTAPQGTPGYVDPEYHEYYQLTDKSDVYSFGVVLIELISSMHAVDISRRRHEINLSNMAIKKIQSGALHEIVDPTLGFESDFKVRKMISAVAELAFQCLQSSKDVRPTMAEVLDRLEDIRSDGKYKSKHEVLDISEDDTALLKIEPPPPSPDSNFQTVRSIVN